MASSTSQLLSADEASVLLQNETLFEEESDCDEYSDDGSDDGDVAEGDYIGKDGSQVLVENEILLQIRS